MIYIFTGLIIGFFVALPVGAAAVMCISRSVQYGLKSGLITGLGVALADLFYGIFAVFGIFAISGETLESNYVLRLAGAFCIMFVGLRMMTKIPSTNSDNTIHETSFKDLFSGFLVTISNPMTVIAFVAALSYVNFLMNEINFLGSAFVVLGIFLGSMVWWTVLCTISIKLKNNLTPSFLRKINLISGSLVFIFGILLVFSIKNL